MWITSTGPFGLTRLEPLTMARIFITGATGFIGRALCRHLISDGCTVIGAVRSKKSQSRLVSGVIPFLCGDLQEKTDWSPALQGVDEVVHLAARVHVLKETEEDAAKVFHRLNVDATRELAGAAARSGVKRFVFLSSVKVNGEFSIRPYREEDPVAPRDLYGISKKSAEETLRSLARETALECTIVRPPLVYGQEVGANFLKLMQLVASGLPLPLASIRNRRSFVYVENLVSAIAACIRHPAAANQTFFVNDGQDLSTPQLLRGIAEGLGKPVRLFPFPVRLLEGIARAAGLSETIRRLTESLAVDSAKIQNSLGWHPPFSVQTGLARTARCFSERSLGRTAHE
jgi:UDP-N-acetyl-alpha-D-quinovosamine dehydrogenase